MTDKPEDMFGGLPRGKNFELWEDMPEFEQPSQKPFAEIKIRVQSEADLIRLGEALGLKLTVKTRSAWFPEKDFGDAGSKRWT